MVLYFQCAGITRCGVRCKRMLKDGITHCHQHKQQTVVESPVVVPVVPVDPVAHAEKVKYDRYEDSFPDMADILNHPNYQRYERMSEFISAICNFDNNILNAQEQPIDISRKIFVFTCELMRLNIHLYHDYRIIYNSIDDKMSTVNGLTDYREKLRQDVDPVIRQKLIEEQLAKEIARKLASKRKYIEHIFTGSILGPLIANKISELYTE